MKTNIDLAVVYQKKAAFAYWSAEDSREIGLSSTSTFASGKRNRGRTSPLAAPLVANLLLNQARSKVYNPNLS